MVVSQEGNRQYFFNQAHNQYLQLLAEAASADDAVRRAAARELVTVEPKVAERGGRRVLVLPPNAGYGDVEEPVARAMGGAGGA